MQRNDTLQNYKMWLLVTKILNWAHISPQCMKWRNLTNAQNVNLVFSKKRNWAFISPQCMIWRNLSIVQNVTLVFSKKKNWALISPQCMIWRNLTYKCSKWALVFSKKKNWARMTLVHQPQFACDICKKTFTRKAYLCEKHTCSKKNPEKKHLCKFCNKMFSRIQYWAISMLLLL